MEDPTGVVWGQWEGMMPRSITQKHIFTATPVKGRRRRSKVALLPTDDDKPIGLREWQTNAFNELRRARHVNINAPTGSGKSTLAKVRTIDTLKRNKNMLAIISIPQDSIRLPFHSGNYVMPDGHEEEFELKKDLCDDNDCYRTKSQELIAFLKGPRHHRHETRTILCTHSTLRETFKRLRDSQQLGLLKNLMIWIDESHHVTTQEDSKNVIGTVVSWCLKNDQANNISVNLMTASAFRGDRLQVIDPCYQHKFKPFHYAYDQYFQWLADNSDFESLLLIRN